MKAPHLHMRENIFHQENSVPKISQQGFVLMLITPVFWLWLSCSHTLPRPWLFPTTPQTGQRDAPHPVHLLLLFYWQAEKWREPIGKDSQSWWKILAVFPGRTFTHTNHLLIATWRFLRAGKLTLDKPECSIGFPTAALPSTWSGSRTWTFTNKPATISQLLEPQHIIVTQMPKYSWKTTIFSLKSLKSSTALLRTTCWPGWRCSQGMLLSRQATCDRSRAGQELTPWVTAL